MLYHHYKHIINFDKQQEKPGLWLVLLVLISNKFQIFTVHVQLTIIYRLSLGPFFPQICLIWINLHWGSAAITYECTSEHEIDAMNAKIYGFPLSTQRDKQTSISLVTSLRNIWLRMSSFASVLADKSNDS